MPAKKSPTSLELCAGAGGQAIGLEQAGFAHVGLVEIEEIACDTLRTNRPEWNVVQADLSEFDPSPYVGVDLVSAGVPCPPFSKAGRQLGAKDERDLFPVTLDIVERVQPKAVLIENVRGLLDPVFSTFRKRVNRRLRSLGYEPDWRLLKAADFGVPQLRPRVALVALAQSASAEFQWPEPSAIPPPTVGQCLGEAMAAGGWPGAGEWAKNAAAIAPTLVGGSKKHGGPDLGPTRARQAWARLGVDGRSLANEPPSASFSGIPRLTVEMAGLIQGFPPDWRISGRKTAAYRQVGNAFPPPLARALGDSISVALGRVTSLQAVG